MYWGTSSLSQWREQSDPGILQLPAFACDTGLFGHVQLFHPGPMNGGLGTVLHRFGKYPSGPACHFRVLVGVVIYVLDDI